MLIYEFIPHRVQSLEFRLISIASLLRDFMKKERVLVTKKGVLISYRGSKVIIEEDQGSSGKPVSIVIPEGLQLPYGTGLVSDYRQYDDRGDYIGSCTIDFKSETDRLTFCWNTIIALNELSSRVRCAMTDGIDARGSPFVILGNGFNFKQIINTAYQACNSTHKQS